MLLTLEMTGDDTGIAQRQFVLPYDLSFTRCTLQTVDVNVAGRAAFGPIKNAEA